jgi:hypothetical protein
MSLTMTEEPQPSKADVKPAGACEERSSGENGIQYLKSFLDDNRYFPALESYFLGILSFLVEPESFDEGLSSQRIQDAVDVIDKSIARSLWSDVWDLWASLILIVREIPYNDPKQELLIDFLKRLRQKTPGTTDTKLTIHEEVCGVIPLRHTVQATSSLPTIQS